MLLAFCALLAGLTGALAPVRLDAPEPTPKAKEFLVGADVSMLGRIEKLGGVFRKDGQPADALALMKNGGLNAFRLRLFVNPNHREGVVNDLEYTLALAKRIHALGAPLLLDIHYSDTWADPAHQIKPADWAALDFPALEKRVQEYTAQVLGAFKEAGVLPAMVQVGNEITPGFLWPDGKLSGAGSAEERWDRFTRLVKAGIRGVKQALGPGDHVKIMIHVDRGGDWKATRWFFENLIKRGVGFDVIGQSYYPWWHGALGDVRRNLSETARMFHKDIVIVETAYPYRNKESWDNEPNMAWAVSPLGQKQFLEDLADVVRATPGGHGLGVFYWYPEALPVSGMVIWNEGATALFDEKGNALPALSAMGIER